MKALPLDMQNLLKQVSRSFYLTLHILPPSIKPQLSLAYLLARAADTVADTQLIDLHRRREGLLQLRESIQEVCAGRTPSIPDFGEFAQAQQTIVGQGTPAERTLLEHLGDLLNTLRGFSTGDRDKIRAVLDTITRGQETDLIRFGAASANQISALATDEELDAYTYDVAGCVGEFWTQICLAHVFPATVFNREALIANAIRFGKGLQLVNILRDVPRDLRQGRCYLPTESLSKLGLKPSDLLDAATMNRLRPLYHRYLQEAEDHLSAGWQYIAMLPYRYVRIRLACAWPILIGVKTISGLRQGNVLDEEHRIKLGRADIWRLIFRSILLYPNRTAWNGLFDAMKSKASG
jgi:farnesyl-diphosphate farnesyltransferase